LFSRAFKNKAMGDATSTAELSKDIHWTERLEEYFVTTGEKANCLAWVHKKSEELFSVRKTFIDLPVIVGSGVIAFLNAGSQSMFEDARLASISLGVGSLVVGILNTMGTYFGWSKRAEGHRISAINYAKLYRFIAVELALPRDERLSPHDFLKMVKDSYDRLAEISPLVPAAIIHKFQKRFKKVHDIAKPEEANGLHKIEVYRQPGDDVKSPDSRFSLKDAPSFTQENPMRGAKPAKPMERVPSTEELEDIAKSVQIPSLPKAIARAAEASLP
jgi:hypothetical protein